MSYWQRAIREEAAKIGRIGIDAAHVEAWMRLENVTLDGLSPSQFRGEVAFALRNVDASTPAENAALARSMGL